MLVLLVHAYAAPLDDELGVGRPELADLAWPHFAACTGAEPPSFESLQVEVVEDLGIYAGKAHASESHARLEVVPGIHDEYVLLHELAHLWVDWGPRALDEGLAESLAACVYARMHDEPMSEPPLDFQMGPHLLSWGSDKGLPPEAVEERYEASYRMALLLGQMLPPEQRWSRQGYGWPELWELLWQRRDRSMARYETDDSGETRLRLPLEYMDVYALVMMLGSEADLDGDGLDATAEIAQQTHPLDWDTDGDGWWDGAQPPEGAVALPTEPSCLGIPSEDGEYSWLTGGPEAGTPKRWSTQNRASQTLTLPPSVRTRTWVTHQGPSLRPCSDRPSQAGSWPMREVDPDGDDLVEILEQEQGTDPAVFDTDGDGWWDGTQPRPGMAPYRGPGWRCVGLRRWGWGEVHVGGDEADKVQASLTHDKWGRYELIGVRTEGPPQARAWLELPRTDKPCPAILPLQRGHQCVGIKLSKGKTTLDVVWHGEGVELQRVVNNVPQPVDLTLDSGQRLELLLEAVSFEYGWIELPRGMAECSP
jgi:hypothetical protein